MIEVRNGKDFNEYIESLLEKQESDDLEFIDNGRVWARN